MTYGNGVRDDSQLREVQEIIAKLEAVNRTLAQPNRVTSEMPVLESAPAETATA